MRKTAPPTINHVWPPKKNWSRTSHGAPHPAHPQRTFSQITDTPVQNLLRGSTSPQFPFTAGMADERARANRGLSSTPSRSQACGGISQNGSEQNAPVDCDRMQGIWISLFGKAVCNPMSPKKQNKNLMGILQSLSVEEPRSQSP